MTHTLGYYTGWAVAIVLLFVLPLLVVFIEYIRRVNRQLTDIKKMLPAKPEKSIENNSGNADLK